MTRVISKELLAKKRKTQRVLDNLYRAFVNHMAENVHMLADMRMEKSFLKEARKVAEVLGFERPKNQLDPDQRATLAIVEGEVIWMPVAQVYILETLRAMCTRWAGCHALRMSKDDIHQIFFSREFKGKLQERCGLDAVQGNHAVNATEHALLNSGVLAVPTTLCLGDEEITFQS